MSEEKDVEKIRKLTEKRKSDKVAKYLDKNDVEVVKAAITGLGSIQDETSVNLLSKLIENANPEIRKAALVAFGNGGTEYAKTLIQHRAVVESDLQVQEVAKSILRDYKLK
ncbi:HEAT repeat domain-containing protein [Anaerosporobacter faecicola]|uniref:HEAT repeat domain-containing protein n=1 Tax=Anaerosporobacter faecicola TaxID=2718714 RepID=UPI00143B98B6|nr:HEAT repeat domain-containing protein [Anaerosporobacter faecicola]